MIKVCPFCGHNLQKELQDGLTSCVNCERVLDCSDFNQVLSAGWLVRNRHYNREQIKWHTKLDDELVSFVMTFVHENSYSHQDFFNLIKRIGLMTRRHDEK